MEYFQLKMNTTSRKGSETERSIITIAGIALEVCTIWRSKVFGKNVDSKP